ncbi:MAG: phage major capsid protein [Caulobacteraceae bacterium]
MPKNIKELRAARQAKAKRGNEATARYNVLGATAERTAEQETEMTALGAELDTLEAEVAGLDHEITAEEASARRGALFSAAAAAPLEGARSFGAAGRTTNEPNPETTGGFRSMNDFAHAVVQTSLGYNDARLGATTNTYNSNGGSAGEGFLVPPEYSTQVWDIAFENTDLLGMSNPEPTDSNAVFKPKDETTPWGAVGVQASWRSEGQQMVASKLAVTGEMMTLHELYAFCAASQEVLSDAPMLQDRLTRQAGNAIQWKASDAVMYGDGAGKPLGFMKAPSLITVPKDANQSAKTLSVTNLANMVARVLRTGGKPMWIINPDVLPQLVTLVIPGTNIPAYLPNNQPMTGSPWDGYLMGYPVMFTEHAQTLGTTGDIVCANMSGYYAVTKRGGVDFASSIHLYFDQNLTAFRWTFRLTGQPFLSKPIQPANGNTTKSHFVALATRS